MENIAFKLYPFNRMEIGSWQMEKPGMQCSNSVHSTASSQGHCQDLCEQSPTCIGISYGITSGQKYCRRCNNDTLSSDEKYDFYRRPGKSWCWKGIKCHLFGRKWFSLSILNLLSCINRCKNIGFVLRKYRLDTSSKCWWMSCRLGLQDKPGLKWKL